MDLVWLACLRPMGCHLLNFFEISGRGFRSSAAKLRSKDNIGKLQRRPVFVSAFDAPVRRCAGKTSFFAPIYLTLMKIFTPSGASALFRGRADDDEAVMWRCNTDRVVSDLWSSIDQRPFEVVLPRCLVGPPFRWF